MEQTNVFYLHGRPSPIGQFIRVGRGHRQLEEIVGSGRFPNNRVVFDAAAVERQHDLLEMFREAQVELVLDTNVAELSVEGRYSGAVREAPWANPGGVLRQTDFVQGTNHDVIGKIARFAVKHGFDAVLAPTHLLDSSADGWLPLDRASCIALRSALDREGGSDIAIDYPLLIKNASLRDPAQRRAIIAALAGLPFDYLWLRVSGFGADVSAMGLRRTIAATLDFERLGRPLVMDGVGGVAALAVAAFGAASGICHGVAEKERFDASDWHKPRAESGGGQERRLLVEGLDRLLTVKQVEVLMEAPGARALLACRDRHCCANGFESTIKNPKSHYLRQREQGVSRLASVPDVLRGQHFLDKELGTLIRSARKSAKLRVNDPAIRGALIKTSERLDRLEGILDDLHGKLADSVRSQPIRARVSSKRHNVMGAR
jgi:hypothetical protein